MITSAWALPDPVVRPGDRHDARRPVEGRDVELDARRPVGRHLHDTREARQRLLRRRRALEARGLGAVAAGADGAAGALHAVDQIAVEVADFRRELPLAEEMIEGIRSLVAGEVEDADVDRRDRDPRLLARAEPAELDGQCQGAARPDLRRSLEIDLQRARRAVDREPRHAERASRQALRRLVERPVRERHDVGAGAPFRHARGRSRSCPPARRRRPAAREPCRSPRRSSPCRGSAATGAGSCARRRGSSPLSRVEIEEIRRIGGLVAGPADRERHARLRRLAEVGRAHLQAVGAPFHRHGDARGVRRSGRSAHRRRGASSCTGSYPSARPR